MARIAGIDLPREKRVEIGLTYIYGIGKPTAQKILAETGVNADTRVKDLSEEEVNKIRNYVEHNLCTVKSLSISSVLWKSDATAACVIARVSP